MNVNFGTDKVEKDADDKSGSLDEYESGASPIMRSASDQNDAINRGNNTKNKQEKIALPNKMMRMIPMTQLALCHHCIAFEETAKRMIWFLKQNRFGRATFLPLTSMKARGGIQRSEALKEKGVIGVADTLVKSDPAYRELVGYLLGRTLVVDNIDTGTAIARKYQQSLRIVTLEGELINPGIHDRRSV